MDRLAGDEKRQAESLAPRAAFDKEIVPAQGIADGFSRSRPAAVSMRDIALSIVVLIGLVWTIRYPFVGVLLWGWITLMDPHQLAFGFSRTFQINLLVAVVTLLSLLFSKERKLPRLDANVVINALFLVWITINSFQAVYPADSWPMWDRVWRLIVFGILVGMTATNRVRIHCLMLVWAMSLLWFGVKGGVFTLTTGGGNHVEGPPDSMIGDNNQLALAILMALPLANYIRLHSANIWVRYAFLTAIGLSVVSVLGSYSRGAFIALAGLLAVGWFRSRRKFLYPLVAALIVIPALQFMPDSFYERMHTITAADKDGSFQGRVDAWHVAYGYAKDHFPFGAGFNGPQQKAIFNHYEPGKDTHAAHSIFFEVLGDNGFVGLFLYLALLANSFLNAARIRRSTRKRPELAWAYDLAGMVQLTLFVFCLGGSALSFAYYDGVWICAALLSVLRRQVISSTAPAWRGSSYQAGPTPLSATSFADGH
jgi:probable O-glycosylation ligase (exosortase A-associated)